MIRAWYPDPIERVVYVDGEMIMHEPEKEKSTMRNHLRIENGERPNKHRVWINGLDISRLVDAAQISIHAGMTPYVELSMPRTTGNIELDLADPRIVVDEQTSALLIALGWTPPPDDVEPDPRAVLDALGMTQDISKFEDRR